MKEEYDVKALNPRKNPYAKKTKQQITMNMNISTVDYFKACLLNQAYHIRL